jgi:hypothetical protein
MLAQTGGIVDRTDRGDTLSMVRAFSMHRLCVGGTELSATAEMKLPERIQDCQALSLALQSCSRLQRSHLGLRASQICRP